MTMPERPSRSACGPHTELAKNEGARITRCACGTIHVHIARSGVTLQLGAEALLDLAAATGEAAQDVRALEGERDRTLPDSCVH
jgi:hypothetical protein